VNADVLWERLEQVIRKQEQASGGREDEYVVVTKLKQRRRNLIQIGDGKLVRLSDGNSSQPQTISKADVFTIAKWAMDSPDGTFSIKDPDLKPARMGSIVCTLLALLPEFDYRPGQVLVYRKTGHGVRGFLRRIFRSSA